MWDKLIEIITNEKQRIRLQYLILFLILGVVAAFMTVLNIITHKGTLIWATGVFAVLCGINFFIVLSTQFIGHKHGEKHGDTVMSAVSVIFMVEMIALFLFFIISGNPDGFSAIWVVMLPSCGMLVFGKKRASFLSALVFILLIFLFWTPVGRSLLQYEYNETFMMRLPMLYMAFFFVPFLQEMIRETTQKQLSMVREQYEYLSAHDCLTNLLNRQGLMDLREKTETASIQAVFMIDIDHFKSVNDSYGHDAGDLVLAGVARITSVIANAPVCRWGGEEFVVWFPDAGKMCDPEEIRRTVEEMSVTIPHSEKKVKVTVSIGVAKGSGELQELVTKADRAMYHAKNNGRNRVESI